MCCDTYNRIPRTYGVAFSPRIQCKCFAFFHADLRSTPFSAQHRMILHEHWKPSVSLCWSTYHAGLGLPGNIPFDVMEKYFSMLTKLALELHIAPHSHPRRPCSPVDKKPTRRFSLILLPAFSSWPHTIFMVLSVLCLLFFCSFCLGYMLRTAEATPTAQRLQPRNLKATANRAGMSK